MRVRSDDGLSLNADRAEVARLQLAPNVSVELMRTSFQRQVFPKHAHEYFTLGVGLRGTGVLWFRGGNHVRRRDDLVVLRPDEVHTGRPAPGSALLSYLAVHVPESVLAMCAEASRLNGGRHPVVHAGKQPSAEAHGSTSLSSLFPPREVHLLSVHPTSAHTRAAPPLHIQRSRAQPLHFVWIAMPAPASTTKHSI